VIKVFIDNFINLLLLQYMNMILANLSRPEPVPDRRCDECGSELRLFGVEEHPSMAATLHSYVCTECDAIATAIIRPGPQAISEARMPAKQT
jgi:hypothetical protein